MDKELNSWEKRYWIIIYILLLASTMLGWELIKGSHGKVDVFAFAMLLFMDVIVLLKMMDKVNDIHRERELIKYEQTLQTHKNDIGFLKTELMKVQERVKTGTIAVTYNMGKSAILKDMIRELETKNKR